MTGLEILGGLAIGLVVALLFGFVVEAANEFGNAPKPPQRLTPAELKTLVRREFTRSPIPDDSAQRLAAFILEGKS